MTIDQRDGVLSDLFRVFWPPLPVWRRLDLGVAITALYTAVVVAVVRFAGVDLHDWGGASTLLNTFVIGLLLSFRMQAAYDRWWEGRRLWGQLVNDSRSLASKVAALPALGDGTRREVARLVPAFAVALKLRLRGEPELQHVSGFADAKETPGHVPLFLYHRLLQTLSSERQAGRVTDLDLLILDPHLRGLMDVCGGCERIRATLPPLSWRSLLRHGLVLYLATTPWLVADHLAWWSVLVVSLIAYFLLGVELTAENVEEPFGHDADDLALAVYCDTIRQSVEQVLDNG